MTEQEGELSALKAFKKRINDIILAGCINVGLALGSELGLFKVMSQFDTWATSQEIAEASKCKERYIREWLYHMTSCEVIQMKEGSQLFYLPLDHREALTSSPADGCMVHVSRYLMAFGCAFPQLHEAFKEDGPPGIDFPVSRILLSYWEQDRDMEGMLNMMLPQLPEDVRTQLETGIECCDVGGGKGTLVLNMARRFPNSHFSCCDFSATALDEGRADAARLGITNVAFVQQDMREPPEEWIGKFDYIIMVDVLHDLPDPFSAVKNLYKMLKPGCCVSLVDCMVDSDPHLTVKNKGCALPSQLLYSFSLYHCMSACLAYPGAAGLGPTVGHQNITKILNEGGFNDVQLGKLPIDYLFVCRKPKQ